ncbi:MAG: thymidine phosphorylase [Pseudomonadota bacterium]
MDGYRPMLDRLRLGFRPSSTELERFASGLADGSVTDAQAGAFAMAVCQQGLGEAGRLALTEAMRDTGRVMSWQLETPVVDKHSTGGIGDSVSLVLGPALAACGLSVPKISGRGLGHTGGTLDKLEAIPGLSCTMPEDRFRRIVGQVGCAIVAASAELAPADKRLYALRDETGTVASIDLITASILSKKLAEGLDALVLDVKVGRGAFMSTLEEAEHLAEALVQTARDAGCPTGAVLSNMDEPLVPSMGNALEVLEVMEVMTGGAPESDLPELAGELGGDLLLRTGLAETPEHGSARIQEAILDGSAAEVFGKMVAAMGGPGDFLARYSDRLPGAPVIHEVPASREGFLSSMDGQQLGDVVVGLGGGRRVAAEVIDPAVGLSDILALGDYVEAGEPICVIHAATQEAAERAAAEITAAIEIADTSPEIAPLVLGRVSQ